MPLLGESVAVDGHQKHLQVVVVRANLTGHQERRSVAGKFSQSIDVEQVSYQETRSAIIANTAEAGISNILLNLRLFDNRVEDVDLVHKVRYELLVPMRKLKVAGQHDSLGLTFIAVVEQLSKVERRVELLKDRP